MDGREIVLRAVLFECPERVPITWLGQGKISDVAGVSYKIGNAWIRPEDGPIFWKPKEQGEDEWHCIWRRPSTGRTMGQVKIHPLTDWDELSTYDFPETRISERFEGVKQITDEIHKVGKYVLGGIGLGFWELYRGIRGTESAITDLYRNRDKMVNFIDRIVDFHVELVKEYGVIGVDGVSWYDDWGTQKGGMVSPEIWRNIFKSRYKGLTEAAKKRGIQTFFHSCGYVYDYIPDMIDAGVDMLNFNQPELLGIDNLGQDFGGDVCFVASVDLQRTLDTGKLNDITNEVKHIISALGCFDGGLILEGWNSDILAVDGAGWESGGYLQNYDVEIANGMYGAYLRFGKYPRRII